MFIRPATLADAPAMLAIYAPIVRDTAISFETEPPTLAEFENRIHKDAEGWAWLVAELDDRVVGYAYGTPHRERAAYRWSMQTSAYVDSDARQRLPNVASVALHRSVGFTPIDR